MPENGGDLSEESVRAIDRFVDDWVVEEDVPGVSIAVFDHDGIRYANGYGVRNLETRGAATPETLYYAGSITKIATAIAVLQHVERGELALEDAVADYVDFLADVPGEAITVRELLSHTSGMPSDAVAFRDNLGDVADLRLHVDGASDRRLTDRDRFMYYNSGYKVLGELVAVLDGRSYTDYVEREVLEPLGMERSTFDQDVLEEGDAMTGYTSEDGQMVPQEEQIDFEKRPSDGGLVAPVTDLSRLGQWLLGDGRLEGTRVLDADLAEAMRTEQAFRMERVDGSRSRYGYGVMVDDLFGDTEVGHGGTVTSGKAYLGALRERELGVAAAFNTMAASQWELGKGVLAIAAGEAPRRVTEIALKEKAEAVAGTYESYRGSAATVEADGAGLAITIEQFGEELTAFPESGDPDDYTYYTVNQGGHRSPVEFVETEAGMAMLWSRARFDRTD